MSIAARGGPSDGPRGGFSRGSAQLRPLQWAVGAAPRGAVVSQRLLCKGSSLLPWSVLFRWPGGQGVPWARGAWKRTFWPSVHSRARVQVVSLGCQPLMQPATHHFRGRKWFCEKEIAFLWLSSTWELFENSDAGNTLCRFCIWWTGKSLAIFLHTMHP